jgi:hypothetical protein
MDKYSNISIHTLSSSTREGQYLLSCNGQYYEANLPIVEPVEEQQTQPTEEEAIAAYVSRKEGKYTPKQVQQIISKFITLKKDLITCVLDKKKSQRGCLKSPLWSVRHPRTNILQADKQKEMTN